MLQINLGDKIHLFLKLINIYMCCNIILQLRVTTFDTAQPSLVSTCSATVAVVRNPNSPVYRGPYTVTVPETYPVWMSVMNATFVDPDGVRSVFCVISFQTFMLLCSVYSCHLFLIFMRQR